MEPDDSRCEEDTANKDGGKHEISPTTCAGPQVGLFEQQNRERSNKKLNLDKVHDVSQFSRSHAIQHPVLDRGANRAHA